MDRFLLLQHFDELAETPDAVAKLRDVVLNLAVRGNLISQSEKDEPGTELLRKILEEKRRLTRDGFIKKSPILDSITPDVCPFEIPKNWAWAYLNDFGDWGSGATPNRTNHDFYDGTIPWLKSGELNDGIVSESEEKVTELALEKCSLRLNKPGDVLLAMYGATVGKVAILGVEATTNQAVCACTCFNGVFNRYLFFLLKAFKQQFISESAGAAQPNFSKDKIIRTVAPLPPPEEQRRIVAKVEELLALCDELEAAQTAAREHRANLVRSALDHLTTTQTEPEFRQHSAFVLQHSDLVLDSVSTLRQTINSLAIAGRLLPQNVKDEPAKALLTRIRFTKSRLAETLGAKPPKVWPTIEADELAFPLPKNWTATCLGDLAINIEAGFSPQCEGRPKTKDEWGILKISAVSWDKFDPEENKALPANVEPRPELEVRDGDFIMSRANTAELVAKSVVANKPPPRLLLNDKTLRVQFTEHTDKRFLNMVNNSSVSRAYYAKAASGTSSSMKNMTREGISMLPIALPPLAEQQRIVAKVDELMRWCDALETRLTAAQTSATQLLDATLHQILAA